MDRIVEELFSDKQPLDSQPDPEADSFREVTAAGFEDVMQNLADRSLANGSPDWMQ